MVYNLDTRNCGIIWASRSDILYIGILKRIYGHNRPLTICVNQYFGLAELINGLKWLNYSIYEIFCQDYKKTYFINIEMYIHERVCDRKMK